MGRQDAQIRARVEVLGVARAAIKPLSPSLLSIRRPGAHTPEKQPRWGAPSTETPAPHRRLMELGGTQGPFCKG